MLYQNVLVGSRLLKSQYVALTWACEVICTENWLANYRDTPEEKVSPTKDSEQNHFNLKGVSFEKEVCTKEILKFFPSFH